MAVLLPMLAGCVSAGPVGRPSETGGGPSAATPDATIEPSAAGGEVQYTVIPAEGVTDADLELASAFIEYALDPTTVSEGLIFDRNGVQLGVMQHILATRSPDDLADRSAWLVGSEDDLFFESQGPYSALEPVQRWAGSQDSVVAAPVPAGFEVAVGEHEGCPYQIEGVPPGMETARQVWLTPVGEQVSCASGWFAVDLFVSEGTVTAVTVELGSP